MVSFEAFLAERGDIGEYRHRHYLRWVQLYENFLNREYGIDTYVATKNKLGVTSPTDALEE